MPPLTARKRNPLVDSKNVLSAVVADCHTYLGIVGEDLNLQAIYAAGTSRLLAEPLSLIFQGASSAGKSYLVNQTIKLLPTDAVVSLTRVTPKALFYVDSGLEHKLLVTGERAHVKCEDIAEFTSALRQFKSEGYLSQVLPEQVRGQWENRVLEVKGPIAHIETTTLSPGDIFKEDLNRTLLLHVDESKDQTRRILDHIGQRAEAGDTPAGREEIIGRHREFQSSLKSFTVAVPYAGEVMRSVPDGSVEARRIGSQIINLVRAITLLHQNHRKQDNDGNLVADLDDYRMARPILSVPLHGSLKIPPLVVECYERIQTHFGDGEFTVSAVAAITPIVGKECVKKHFELMSGHGFIVLVEKSRGPRPAKWKLGGRAPGDEILPDL